MDYEECGELRVESEELGVRIEELEVRNKSKHFTLHTPLSTLRPYFLSGSNPIWAMRFFSQFPLK